MSEQAPITPAENNQVGYDKAIHMAYAEKPGRDDAHELGQMAARASVAAEGETPDQWDDIEMDLGTPSERHARSLRGAQEEAVSSAQAAGEKQGHAYDHAEELRQQTEAAEKALH